MTTYEYIVSGGQFVALLALAVTVVIHFWKERADKRRDALSATLARGLAADQASPSGS